MALVIISENTLSGVEWHIGQKNPMEDKRKIRWVTEIQLSGDELQHVFFMFDVIGKRPSFMPTGNVVTLYGDLARTIVANLTNTS